MKNFEERMDAIKARSHARIARRRKQIVSLCVPLAVALCISSTFLLNDKTVIFDDANTIPTTIALNVFSGSVTVTGGGTTETHIDAAVVDGLLELLDAVSQEQEALMTAAQTYKDDRVFLTSVSRQYLIKMGTPDGEVVSYMLKNAILTNCQTQEQLILSSQRLRQLLELLELE